eukprot:gene50-4300_t
MSLTADEQGNILGEVYAKYDFIATDSSEISFNAGDLIQILSKDDSGWWNGRNSKTGEIGFFPSNYVSNNSN